MSYNGTVSCRHCYGRGHNRRTCPDYTERLRQRAQAELDEGEGVDGYFGKQFALRTQKYIDGTPIPKEMKKTRAGGKRRCQYCAKTGHNTRTCPELKSAKVDAITNTASIRQNVVNALQEQGLGIGALVTVNQHAGPVGYMVTGFNWSAVTAATIDRNPNIVQLQVLNPALVPSYMKQTGCPLPPIEGVNDNSWDTINLVAPVSGSAALINVPDGWVESQDWLEGQFDGAKSPNWNNNYYDY
jgi:hypothetical protein